MANVHIPLLDSDDELSLNVQAKAIAAASSDATSKAAAAQSAAVSAAATDATTKASAAQSAAISAASADATSKAAAAQAAAIQRANHTGSQSADTVVDGTTNKAYTAAEKTKLAGVANSATANSSDAQLRDRSTHTGTQSVSTITGLGGAATLSVGTTAGTVAAGDDSRVGAGGGIPTSRTISTTAPLTGGGELSANRNIGITVGTTSSTVAAGDAPAAAQAYAVQRSNHTGTQSADTLTDGTTGKVYTATEKTKLSGVATGATANATDAQLRARSTHTGTQAVGTITGLGGAATLNVGTGSGTVAAGNDARCTGVPTTTQAGSYTLALADAGTVIESTSGSPATFAVPPNSLVAFPVGTVVEVVQYGTGQVTIAAGAGVTLRTPASLTSRA